MDRLPLATRLWHASGCLGLVLLSGCGSEQAANHDPRFDETPVVWRIDAEDAQSRESAAPVVPAKFDADPSVAPMEVRPWVPDDETSNGNPIDARQAPDFADPNAANDSVDDWPVIVGPNDSKRPPSRPAPLVVTNDTQATPKNTPADNTPADKVATDEAAALSPDPITLPKSADTKQSDAQQSPVSTDSIEDDTTAAPDAGQGIVAPAASVLVDRDPTSQQIAAPPKNAPSPAPDAVHEINATDYPTTGTPDDPTFSGYRPSVIEPDEEAGIAPATVPTAVPTDESAADIAPDLADPTTGSPDESEPDGLAPEESNVGPRYRSMTPATEPSDAGSRYPDVAPQLAPADSAPPATTPAVIDPSATRKPTAPAPASVPSSAPHAATGPAVAPALAKTPADNRPRELEAVARSADEHIRKGFELATRKALFAARVEFIKALRIVSQALDISHPELGHCDALADGLRALKEADDFMPRGSNLEGEIDVMMIASAHQTPAVRSVYNKPISALQARQAYFSYAQKRLADSVGHEVAGSMALHALGKIYAAMAQQTPDTIADSIAKATVFQQAALLVHMDNSLAANDLGVLLARVGRFDEARQFLLHSLAVAPQPASWNNLAVVYEQLGDAKNAQAARENSTRLAAVSTKGDVVKWIDPEKFAETSKPANTESARSATPSAAPHSPTAGVHASNMPTAAAPMQAGRSGPARSAMGPNRTTAAAPKPDGGWNWLRKLTK